MAARRPDDWLALVASCVVSSLTARPTGWTGLVYRGFDGGGAIQPCCDNGLLRVEWIGTENPGAGGPAQRCRQRATVEIAVIIRRCTTAFDTGAGGTTTGAAPKIEVAEAEAALLMDDAWTIWTALGCCIDQEWKDDHISLESQSFDSLDTCKGSTTVLRLPLAACCPAAVQSTTGGIEGGGTL